MINIPKSLSDIPRGYMITTSGNLINLYDPDPSLIEIEDIAGSLSKLCRWGGNIPEFYSVAQHSCHVVSLAPRHLRFAALMHDAPEAYAGDVIRPIKSLLAISYFEIEERLKQAVCERFNLHADLLEGVKQYDNEALDMEFNAFYHQDKTSINHIRINSSQFLEHLPSSPFWDPQTAFVGFLRTYSSLVKIMSSDNNRLPRTG